MSQEDGLVWVNCTAGQFVKLWKHKQTKMSACVHMALSQIFKNWRALFSIFLLFSISIVLSVLGCGKPYNIKCVFVYVSICSGLKPYLCSVCDYAGRSRSNLKTHMNRHNTDRPHLCDLCGKKFKSKATLKSHRQSHTKEGTWTFLCRWWWCILLCHCCKLNHHALILYIYMIYFMIDYGLYVAIGIWGDD